MSDGPDIKAITLGRGAERLMAEEAFEKAVERVEQDIISEWKVAETVGAREKAHARMEVLYDVVRALGAVRDDGAMEEAKEDE